MFIGENLQNIRIMHGFTRKQLGDKLEITEQSIWQYENGYLSPKMEVLNKLKKIFHVRSQYFYTTDLLNQMQGNNIDLRHIAYRSTTINSIQKTEAESKHIAFIDAFLKRIERNVKYPTNRLDTLRDYAIELLNNEHGSRLEKVKEIALKARRILEVDKLGNENLLYTLEKYGAFIIEKPIGDKVDAYSLWTLDNRPYIILGNIKKSAVRRNFDLAHELGHLLIHYKVEFTTADKKDYRKYEQEANIFAGEFLLPEDDFTSDILNLPKKSNPDFYLDLKKKWYVSIQAMAYRAHQLNLITYQQYRYFNMQIHRRGYKSSEPLDNVINIAKPGKIPSILELLFKKKYISLDYLLDSFNVDVMFLVNLLGIDEGFFTKYEIDTAKTFSIAELKPKYGL